MNYMILLVFCLVLLCISVILFMIWFLFLRNPKVDIQKIIAMIDEQTVYESDVLTLKDKGIKGFMLKVRGVNGDIQKMVNRFKGLNWIICIKTDMDIEIIKNILDKYTACAGVKAFYFYNHELDISGDTGYYQKLEDIYRFYINRRSGLLQVKKVIVETNALYNPFLPIDKENIFEDICDLKSFMVTQNPTSNIDSDYCIYIGAKIEDVKTFRKFLKSFRKEMNNIKYIFLKINNNLIEYIHEYAK